MIIILGVIVWIVFIMVGIFCIFMVMEFGDLRKIILVFGVINEVIFVFIIGLK